MNTNLPNKNCNISPQTQPLASLRTWVAENLPNEALKVSYPNVKNELPQYFETPAPLLSAEIKEMEMRY